MCVSGIPSRHSSWEFQSRSRFLRAAERSTHSALWLHHAHPFVAVAWKTCLIEISRGFGHGVVVLKICYNAATMQWLCSQLCYVTAANQWTIVEIELLAIVGWKWGCQPFSCRCSQNATHCRKEICSTCLFKESFPATPVGIFNHPLPARSRFLRAAASSTPSALWLHHAHPFIAVAWKTCLIEISRGFGHGVAVLKICYNAVIVLSVVLCDCCKPMNSCRDWAFSNSGLEVGLPAFQLPMFPKFDTLPKGDLFDMFV